MKNRERNNSMNKMSLCLAMALQTMNYPTGEYDEMSKNFFEAIKCGNRLDANEVIWNTTNDIWNVIDTDDILMYPLPSRKFENFLNRAAMRRIMRRNMKLAGDGFSIEELRNLFPDR